MPCCLAAIAVFIGPRLALFLTWLFSDYLNRAYTTWIWPLLGFFFLPWTTIAYAVAENGLGGLHGWGLAVFVVGLFFDFASWGGGGSSRRRRRTPTYSDTYMEI